MYVCAYECMFDSICMYMHSMYLLCKRKQDVFVRKSFLIEDLQHGNFFCVCMHAYMYVCVCTCTRHICFANESKMSSFANPFWLRICNTANFLVYVCTRICMYVMKGKSKQPCTCLYACVYACKYVCILCMARSNAHSNVPHPLIYYVHMYIHTYIHTYIVYLSTRYVTWVCM